MKIDAGRSMKNANALFTAAVEVQRTVMDIAYPCPRKPPQSAIRKQLADTLRRAKRAIKNLRTAA